MLKNDANDENDTMKHDEHLASCCINSSTLFGETGANSGARQFGA